MNKIAILGPSGTFSELAAKKYMKAIDKNIDTALYPTIKKVFKAIGRECDLGIIPIENTLDGYVQLTLDLLSQTDLHIIYEFVLPIQFSFVGNSSELSKIKKIYAQFKTQGQCSNFLEQFTDAKIITTESNGESFEEVRRGVLGESAIIPKYLLKTHRGFSLNVENVTDLEENETRFIVLSKIPVNYNVNKRYKTSLVIMDTTNNKPGVLSNILNEFSEKNINLASIISHPTKRKLGEYYFFIDVDGRYPDDENIRQVIEKISKNNTVKILGSYPSI